MGAHAAYIYIRGEFIREKEALQAAIDECLRCGPSGQERRGSGWDFDLYCITAPAPISAARKPRCWKALRQEGHARMKPPFPAGAGLYGCPTTVNNVRSIAVVPTILRRGPEWFASFGRPNNAGVKLFGMTGHVNSPCVVEETMSIPMRELIERHGGGMRGGWKTSKR